MLAGNCETQYGKCGRGRWFWGLRHSVISNKNGWKWNSGMERRWEPVQSSSIFLLASQTSLLAVCGSFPGTFEYLLEVKGFPAALRAYALSDAPLRKQYKYMNIPIKSQIPKRSQVDPESWLMRYTLARILRPGTSGTRGTCNTTKEKAT